DDEDFIRQSFCAYLEDFGYTVFEAANGREGLDVFRKEKINLILVDLRMPEIDGLEVLDTVKNESPDTPVIVVSGTGVIGDVVDALHKGAWDYILKPIQEMSVLIHAVEKALERANLINENREYQEHLEDEVSQRTKELRLSNEVLIKEVKTRKKAEQDLRLSEQKMESIIKFVPDIIYRLDPFGRISFVSDAVKKYGYDPEELIGHNMLKLIHPDDQTKAQYCVKERRTGERRTRMLEVRLMTKEKKILPFELQSSSVYLNPVFLVEASGIYDNNKSPGDSYMGTQGIARDITSRKEAEEALRKSEENLAITLRSIGEAVTATDTEGRITRMNPVAEHLTGWKFKEAINKPFQEVFNLKNAKSGKVLYDPLHNIIVTGNKIEPDKNTLLVAKDGVERRISFSSAPINDRDYNIVGAVLVFRDITEEYRMQEQLKQSHKMESIGQLAGGVAHDFNNMLSGIMGAAELLSYKLSDADEKIKSYINLIMETSERASDLTNKLLAFSRKGKKESVPLDMNDTIQEVASILEHTIDKRIMLSQNLSSNEVIIEGDPSQVQNAILNLAVNARDAMPNGGEISFSSNIVSISEEFCRENSLDLNHGRYSEVVVSDTGIGMSEEIQKHIFEPFYTTKGKSKGTGLGLAAVYGTVKEHNGVIKVFSEIGKGTSFTLYLPLSSKGKKGKSEKEEVLKGTGEILLVEDEEIIRHIAKDMLENMGYQVTIAKDGQEGIEIFSESYSDIDLVVLDLVMPRMDGATVFNALKRINPLVKVIIASGFSHKSKNATQLLAEGAIGFIQKPYREVTLSKAIYNAIYCIDKKEKRK
ncbi:MAG: response regulator, partial [Calditrichia bacterium]|nr:response regulator [Calditrichia bacterium]